MKSITRFGLLGTLSVLFISTVLTGCPSKNSAPTGPAATATPVPPTATLATTATATNSPTKTSTVTPSTTTTASVTPSNTATASPTSTSSNTATATPSGTGTASPTGTSSNTDTATPTGTPTLTASPTATPTGTGTPSDTPTNTLSATETDSPTQTASSTPSSTATVTFTPTVTVCTAPVQYGVTTYTTIGFTSGVTMFCEAVTLTSSVYVNSMSMEMAGAASQMRVGIYTNQVIASGYYTGANYPDSLVTVSDYQDISAAGWVTIGVPATYLTAIPAGTIYWLAWGGTDSTGSYSFYTNENTIWGLSENGGTTSPNFPATADINDAGGGSDTPLVINGCP